MRKGVSGGGARRIAIGLNRNPVVRAGSALGPHLTLTGKAGFPTLPDGSVGAPRQIEIAGAITEQ